MSKEELFLWALDNVWKYPVLNNLTEETINGTAFIFLPGQYGAYIGIYLCFEENKVIYDLRNAGYLVGKIDSYETAKTLFLESGEYINKMAKRKSA